MSRYHRVRLPGGTYFFTVVIADRHRQLLVQYIEQLKTAYRHEQLSTPFANLGLVVLPDHLHALWRLPEGDSDYSSRWRRIKGSFSRAISSICPAAAKPLSASRVAKGELGIWQRRFWEYTIRDEEDLRRHLDYIHWNPVKHGLVSQAIDWPHSTFRGYVERGYYLADWGSSEVEGNFGE